ncbi:peptidylprolyl isomerase [Salegentibacter sp. F188]|uniref:Periplasmic chaperone PpiD n=1 Tax=Autumnicola patrickiae TaxID=3075591 RepID=A0ABU3E0A1_9FLAO|nr:peptidylprolyl isomerase [Salegentibacter sp. F188]MDT0689391.1 peptidylprolyl isomerase [Salegentibacter sp. F188]
MAVLNKIRQRSVFLIIIIALALFSFVLADVLRNGGMSSQKSQNTIATVNGEEISREEFAMQVEALQRNTGGNVSTIQAANRVWEQKLREVIIKDQLEEIGLRAEEDQITQMIRLQMANNPNFQNEAGMFDENRLKEYVANMRATSPEAYAQWQQYTQNMAATARQNLYYSMISAGVGATVTEAEQTYKLENNSIDLKFVQVPYSSISDDEVEVSKSEIKDYVKNHPARFETEKSRNLQFVYFEETASSEDKSEAQEEIQSLMQGRAEYNAASGANDSIAGFGTTEDVENFVNQYSDTPYNDQFQFRNDLSGEHAERIFNLSEGETYGPYEEDGYWKITRMLETQQIPDSVKASHILVAYEGTRIDPEATRSKAEAEALADSLANVVRRDNSKFEELVSQFSSDRSKEQNAGDLGWFSPGQMIPAFEDYVFANDEGDIGVVETELGYHVIAIDEQTEEEKAVKTATVAKEIIASERSRSDLFNEVTKFQIAASEEDFAEQAKSNDYNVRTVRQVNALDENLPGVGPQRAVIQWAFEEDVETGEVKRFDTPNGYIVAQLTAKNDAGLMSAEEASSTVIPILTKRKKAELIKEKISGNTLEAIAQNQNTIIQTANSVNLNNPTLPGAGNEPEVVGTAFGLETENVSKPIAGDKGVYVVEVTAKNEAPALNSYNAVAQQETMRRRQEASTRVFEALKKKAEIEDNRSRFY